MNVIKFDQWRKNMDKTKIECRKCGKICEVETHELRDVIDATCPKCGSEHIFIRNIHLDT